MPDVITREAESSQVPLFDVALEGVVYTLVDVHAGHDADFERWYENDHFYAGGVLGPHVLAGGRWYASRELREARWVSPRCLLPDPYAGTNLAMYWLATGGLDAFYGWVEPTIAQLRPGGRMFPHRTHVNTDGYRLEQVLDAADRSTVPPHVALDHPFPGVFVSYLAPQAETRAAANLPPRSLSIAFRPNAGSMDASTLGVDATAPGMVFPTDGDPIRLVLTFLPDRPPADAEWTRGTVEAVAAATGSEPLWGGAFLPVVPGSLEHLPSLR
jgi:hypothetical protein